MYKIKTQRKESRFDIEKNILLLYYLMEDCVCVCVYSHMYTHSCSLYPVELILIRH